jgi:hypothetical protein
MYLLGSCIFSTDPKHLCKVKDDRTSPMSPSIHSIDILHCSVDQGFIYSSRATYTCNDIIDATCI